MRLRKIRLAGFKSFVDPTTIEFPGAIVAVVGPNGCGKSNVIDAVRWVMGEVSARHLRGDTMADVVFSGSTTRKPVSQATVELVFDNSEGRLGGRFASYTEIAVKRQVSREGQSHYFLNGSRCRRRDVMDVFHGTGLGPRSYAIIEQGMISRVIEARPEELRDFLEEAAGISKYKERRRETENRIRHTRENLERLTDIRDELGRRLAHLKRQATLAEKYKVLKVEQRELEAQHLALRWRELDAEANAHAEQVQAQQTKVEAAVAGQREVEAALEKSRVGHTDATERFNERYREVLDAGAAIARTEESILSVRQRTEELKESLQREAEALRGARGHLAAEERERADLAASLAASEPELEVVQERAARARLEFRESEEAMVAWQAEFEAISEQSRRPEQAVHAEQARIQQLEGNLEQLASRLRGLVEERDGFDVEGLERDAVAAREVVAESERGLDALDAALAAARTRVDEQRERLHDQTEMFHESRNELGQLRARIASLEALQQDALGKADSAVAEWLRLRKLSEAPRLAECLDVETGWENAVEIVLGSRLEAICVDDPGALAPQLHAIERGHLTLIRRGGDAGAPRGGAGLAPLGGRVRSDWAVTGFLHGVYTADSLEDALAARPHLAPGESVVLRDGTWVGADWLHVHRPEDGASGVIAREAELKRLADAAVEREDRVRGAEREVADTRERLRDAEDELAEAQAGMADRHRQHSELRSALGAKASLVEQAGKRLGVLGAEIQDTETRLEAERQVLSGSRTRYEQSSVEMARLTGEREAWERRRQGHRERLEAARERWQAVRDEAYDLGLKVESMRSRLRALEEAKDRNSANVDSLEERHESLLKALEATREPLGSAQSDLETQLSRRTEREELLRAARTEVENLDEEVRQHEQRRQRDEAAVVSEQSLLQDMRMQGQETVVRRKTVEEQIDRGGHSAPELLGSLEEDATVVAWQERLEVMERRITRLGPINLAAIDEHVQQSERKTYLDAQHADLDEALATLTSAIQKIDRETRARFRETYEKVNEGLSTMFPRLFGGGAASLQLTSEDLLEAGVTVMARPPGKRNASIQLLSGGEKALTAVALVFAIFELNPAPFCLMDEVDAPLDDANVGRFCELVKEMSSRVQLALVTHNKLTMEIAHNLVGVTMGEPGVSRLVAVDVSQAVEMATA